MTAPKIAPEDRKLAIGFALLMALASVLAVFAARAGGQGGALPSSYSAGNNGTKAAFLLLEQMGYAPQRWTANPRKLADLPPHATLILADPIPSDEGDVEAVRQFLRNGGRVVATGVGFAQFVPRPPIRAGTPHFQWKDYPAHEPSELTRGIHAITLAPKFYFDSEKMDAPFLDGDESPVTRFSYGAGEVIWWSNADPMSNSGIRESDNAQLLLNSVGDPGRGPVLWDEYFHQGGKTVVDSVLGSPLRWGLLQAALIGALVCLTYSRSFGPARESVASARLAPMEFVETLAALYQKSGAAHIAVEIVYEQFRGALQRRFSVRTDADAAQVAAAITAHLPGADAAGTLALIRRIEEAVGDFNLPVEQATALVGEMHQLSTRLKLKSGLADKRGE
ncbi:MAG: DUF4350 domain-containing protein [Candidatus Korobacteraceae bacterium]